MQASAKTWVSDDHLRSAPFKPKTSWAGQRPRLLSVTDSTAYAKAVEAVDAAWAGLPFRIQTESYQNPRETVDDSQWGQAKQSPWDWGFMSWFHSFRVPSDRISITTCFTRGRLQRLLRQSTKTAHLSEHFNPHLEFLRVLRPLKYVCSR